MTSDPRRGGSTRLRAFGRLNRQRINSVQHLHKATALPKSTIVRLLESLRLLGYVANDPGRADTR